MELIETLNRTMKLAMDEGVASSYEEAQSLFNSFKLRISIQPGFTDVPAAEAAVLTLLNAAPKTFLGGVELVGALEEYCTQAWFAGIKLGDVAQKMGVTTEISCSNDLPTIYWGSHLPSSDTFCLGVILNSDGFTLSPDRAGKGAQSSPIQAGVAAAGAALYEAFQHAYRKAPTAGQREIRWSLPDITQESPPPTMWLIGGGHLGQAFLWTVALKGNSFLPQSIKLSDYDTVSWSSLSTCLLVNSKDVGKRKVDVIADQLELLGVMVQRDYERLNLDTGIIKSEHELAVVAVDNIALRRSLDRLHVSRILEAGIGNGPEAFTRIQLHKFPGLRKARDIWMEDDVRGARLADLSKPAYQSLLKTSGDECGTALVAGRAVATPFIGAFAGAVLSQFAMNPFGSNCAWNFDVCSL